MGDENEEVDGVASEGEELQGELDDFFDFASKGVTEEATPEEMAEVEGLSAAIPETVDEPAAVETAEVETEEETSQPEEVKAEPAADPRDKEIEELKSLIASSQQESKAREEKYLALLAAKAKDTGQAEGKSAEDGSSEQYKPVFSFSIPEEIAEAITSGDPTKTIASLQALMSGAANHVHKHMMEVELPALREKILNDATATASVVGEQRSTQQKMHDDFYGEYPGYNKPELQGLVGQIAVQYVNELTKGGKQVNAWNAEIRDGIAARMKTVLGGYDGKTVAGSQTPQAGEKPKQKTVPKSRSGNGSALPRTVSPAARAASVPAAQEEQESLTAEILETLRIG